MFFEARLVDVERDSKLVVSTAFFPRPLLPLATTVAYQGLVFQFVADM